jgi:serpin B
MRSSRRPTLFLIAALCACGPSSAPTTPASPITGLPRQLTAAEQQTLAAGNDLSFALFRQLAKSQQGKNVFVSPLSVSMSLGMAMNGASGQTLTAMRSTLGVGPGDLAQINAGYKGLIDLLRTLDPTSTFQLANSIWYRNTFSFKQSFLDTTKYWFDANVQPLDFADVNGSLATINGWVNTKTGGKIPTILDHITPDEVMFLINAIYFKGAWALRFDPTLTTTGRFYAADGSTQAVPMMQRPDHLAPKLRTAYVAPLTLVELPYGSGAFAMDILLPPRGANVDSVAASLSANQWTQAIGALHDDDPALSMPKFTLQYDRTLNDDLTALGMGIAFSDAADFSGMSTTPLKLEFVKQKAFVDVNEEGTEAGAATVTGVVPTALHIVQIDHPFIFVIRERFSGAILFMGKVLRLP